MNKDSTEMATLSENLKGKTVVADTSSLLMAGTGLLSMIEDCFLVIPAVVVKELEDKRIHPTIGFLAREWLRLLEENRTAYGKKLSQGVPIKGYSVVLSVEPNHSTQKSLPEHLQNGSNDSTILAVAVNLKKEMNDVVILSNDVPMRLHATLDLDLDAFEFNATRNIGAKAFSGIHEFTVSWQEYEDGLIGSPDGGSLDVSAQNFINHKAHHSGAATSMVRAVFENGEPAGDFVVSDGKVSRLGYKAKIDKIVARTPEQNAAVQYLQKSAEELPIVSLGGKAGSGKTLLAVANGIQEVKKGNYQKMIVFRSLHEMGIGQEMGFLPGSVEEKMEAWAGAIYDAIDVIASSETGSSVVNFKEKVKMLREDVEVSPITYLRGRSLADTYLILEEAQNFSRSEILNILSRVGKGSKVVLTFDAAQVDNKFLKSGKDADIWSVIDSLKSESLFAHITLNKTERSRVAELAAQTLEKQH